MIAVRDTLLVIFWIVSFGGCTSYQLICARESSLTKDPNLADSIPIKAYQDYFTVSGSGEISTLRAPSLDRRCWIARKLIPPWRTYHQVEVSRPEIDHLRREGFVVPIGTGPGWNAPLAPGLYSWESDLPIFRITRSTPSHENAQTPRPDSSGDSQHIESNYYNTLPTTQQPERIWPVFGAWPWCPESSIESSQVSLHFPNEMPVLKLEVAPIKVEIENPVLTLKGDGLRAQVDGRVSSVVSGEVTGRVAGELAGRLDGRLTSDGQGNEKSESQDIAFNFPTEGKFSLPGEPLELDFAEVQLARGCVNQIILAFKGDLSLLNQVCLQDCTAEVQASKDGQLLEVIDGTPRDPGKCGSTSPGVLLEQTDAETLEATVSLSRNPTIFCLSGIEKAPNQSKTLVSVATSKENEHRVADFKRLVVRDTCLSRSIDK